MASKTIRISSNQKELLLLMFIKLKAHRWDKNALKKLLLELKNTDIMYILLNRRFMRRFL